MYTTLLLCAIVMCPMLVTSYNTKPKTQNPAYPYYLGNSASNAYYGGWNNMYSYMGAINNMNSGSWYNNMYNNGAMNNNFGSQWGSSRYNNIGTTWGNMQNNGGWSGNNVISGSGYNGNGNADAMYGNWGYTNSMGKGTAQAKGGYSAGHGKGGYSGMQGKGGYSGIHRPPFSTGALYGKGGFVVNQPVHIVSGYSSTPLIRKTKSDGMSSNALLLMLLMLNR